MIAALLLSAFAGYALPSNAQSAINEAAKAGQFLFITFHEAKDASFTKMASAIQTFKKSSKKKVAVFNAKVSDPANQDVVGKYGIPTGEELPVVLVFAPNGVVTGGFPKTVTSDQLKQSVNVSELMLKILKPLQEQKVVLVALQNQSTLSNTESWSGVNDFANDAMYSKAVAALKADPAAAENQEFMKQCGLISPLTQATVVVLMPPGRIGKVLTGKVTKKDMLAAIQSCAGGSCCPKK